MITVKGRYVEIKVGDVDEILEDVYRVISAFVRFSISNEVPEDVIEKTLVGMIVKAFDDDSSIMIDLNDDDC